MHNQHQSVWRWKGAQYFRLEFYIQFSFREFHFINNSEFSSAKSRTRKSCSEKTGFLLGIFPLLHSRRGWYNEHSIPEKGSKPNWKFSEQINRFWTVFNHFLDFTTVLLLFQICFQNDELKVGLYCTHLLIISRTEENYPFERSF